MALTTDIRLAATRACPDRGGIGRSLAQGWGCQRCHSVGRIPVSLSIPDLLALLKAECDRRDAELSET